MSVRVRDNGSLDATCLGAGAAVGSHLVFNDDPSTVGPVLVRGRSARSSSAQEPVARLGTLQSLKDSAHERSVLDLSAVIATPLAGRGSPQYALTHCPRGLACLLGMLAGCFSYRIARSFLCSVGLTSPNAQLPYPSFYLT
jgi:hypothetical protein